MQDRLIVALDVASAREAQALIQSLGQSCSLFKVGLQLFTAEGPSIVKDLVGSGKKVFLDLKLHDIPNTVAGAVRSAAELGVDMLTVHASGGSNMLRAAAEASGTSGPSILAVTVLTSLGQGDLTELGIDGLNDHVVRLARLARESRCHGVVASPLEISQIRKEVGDKMLIVTPGIRPVGGPANDQSRTTTPAEALRSGATHLVVGRPITAAAHPAEAAALILKEMQGA